MKIVVTEKPKTSHECLFSEVLANGNLACILDNGNYCNFICENTMQCPCLITLDEMNNRPANKDCTECVVENAIEIVKQGGVSDDVCEWKIKDACYTFSIKHYDALPTSIVKTFTSCPYCRKRIKVV